MGLLINRPNKLATLEQATETLFKFRAELIDKEKTIQALDRALSKKDTSIHSLRLNNEGLRQQNRKLKQALKKLSEAGLNDES